jgi:hypothetical protein
VALNATTVGVGEQRRRARRTAFWLLLLAIAIYGGFIFMSVHKAHA